MGKDSAARIELYLFIFACWVYYSITAWHCLNKKMDNFGNA